METGAADSGGAYWNGWVTRMAICVEVGAGGVLQQSANSIDECTTYALLSAAEYVDVPTLTDIFTIPMTDDLQTMFELGFGLPMIAYLTAWGYGVVINWFNSR